MTRKDYELIARVVAKTNRFDKSRRALVALEFAEELKATNPAFDTDKFLKACEAGR